MSLKVEIVRVDSSEHAQIERHEEQNAGDYETALK